MKNTYKVTWQETHVQEVEADSEAEAMELVDSHHNAPTCEWVTVLKTENLGEVERSRYAYDTSRCGGGL